MFDLFTAVSDNTRPVLSKMFEDFGFFWDVSQTNTVASTVLSIKRRSCKSKCWRERTDSFWPSHICVLLDLEALLEEPKLAMFHYKEDKKLRANVKLTTLFKNTRPNSEVQKQRT